MSADPTPTNSSPKPRGAFGRRLRRHVSSRSTPLAVAALALTLPFAAWSYLEWRLERGVEPALAEAVGAPVSVGRVEASLTGALRMEEVRVADVLEVGALEASVGLASLLAGRIRADEIRIEDPHLRLTLDPRGRARLERMIRRAQRRWRRAHQGGDAGGESGSSQLRRIVVRGGDLVVHLGARGRLRVGGVELHPRPGGVRAVSGAIRAELTLGPWEVRGRFQRAGADVGLPRLGLPRVLAIGGAFAIRGAGGREVPLREAVLARGVGRGAGFAFSGRFERASSHVRARLLPDPAGAQIAITGERVPLALLEPAAPAWLDLAGASASGSAAALTRGPGDFALALETDLEGLVLSHRRLASAPVPIAGELSARARLLAGEDRVHLDLERGRFGTGELALEASGRADLRRPGGVPERADLQVEVPRTSCVGALVALPAPFRDHLTGADAEGPLSAALRLRFDRDAPDETALDVEVDVGDCRVTLEPTEGDPRRLLEPFAHRYPDGSTGRVGRGLEGYAPIGSLPRRVVEAFLAAEDTRFYRHPGFDLRQIERSLAVNLREGKLVRGGSTITQQLAKNVFLAPDRNLARKFQEAILTWRLEHHLTKRQILERYLNIIELAEGVFGITGGARHWFDEEPDDLSAREAAFLAAITSAPRTVSARVRAEGGVPPDLAERVDQVLLNMRQLRSIDRRTYKRARRQRLRLNPAVLQ